MTEETRQEDALGLDSLCGELVHCYQELSLFYRVTERLGEECTQEGIARVALAEVLDAIPSRRASVMVRVGSSDELEILASQGLPARFQRGFRVRIADSLIEEVLTRGRSFLIENIESHRELMRKKNTGSYLGSSMVSVPLCVTASDKSRDVLGCINLSDRLEGRGYYTSEDLKLLTVVASQVAVHIKKSRLFDDLRLSHRQVENALFNTVESLARAAEERDQDTGVHINRVGKYARLLAHELGMGHEYCEQIFHFAKLHDVGKIHVHPDVLTKRGPLDDKEWESMKRHCEAGSKIIGTASGLRMAREIALSHHEQWDGNGYPAGLRGQENSLAGMITKLADIYDALRSARSYKPPFSHDKTCSILLKGDGRTQPSHFPPQMLEAFSNIHPKFERICAQYQDDQQEATWGARF